MLILFTAVVFFTWKTAQSDEGSNWGYKSGKSFSSPDQWKSLSGSSCGGTRQSPVNIIKMNTQFWSALQTVTLPQTQSSKTVALTKSSTSLALSFNDDWTINFSGVGCLKAVNIHWHWGSTDSQGSEHTLDGAKYSMEGHIVTYNCALYKSFTDAVKSPSGLYVFAVLYKVDTANPAIGKLMPNFDTLLKSGIATISEISPTEFFPKNLASYYRYEGSLTTPPCTENVIWTVFREIQTLSSDQLAKFRSLQFGTPEEGAMGDNFRPAFQLDSTSDSIPRVIYASRGVYVRTYNLLSLYWPALWTALYLQH